MKKVYLFLLMCCLSMAASAQTTYYNTTGAAPNLPASWSTDPSGAGAGTHPSNFSTAGDVFNLNFVAGALTGTWTLDAVSLNVNVGLSSAKPVALNGTTVVANDSMAFTAASATLTVGDGTHATSVTMVTGNLRFTNATAKLIIAANGTVDMQTNSLAAYSPSTISNNGLFRTANTSATPFPASKDFTNANTATGTVEFYSASNQTIVTGTYYNLVADGGASSTKTTVTLTIKNDLYIGACTFALGNTVTVSNNVVDSATGTLSLGTRTLNIAGNFTNNGTLTAGTGTIAFNATSGTHTIDGNFVTPSNFKNLTFSGAGGTWQFGASANIVDVSGIFTQSNGTLTTPADSLRVGGNFVHSGGTFTNTTGTVKLSGAGAQALTCTSPTSFNVLTLDNITTPRTITASGTIAIASAFTIPSGVTLSMGTTSLTLSSDYTNNGTLTASTSTITFNATSTGHTLNGTLSGTTGKFYNVIFDGVGGAWSYSANGEVANQLTLNNGTLTAPSGTLTITGHYSNSATFNNNGGTVVFNSAVAGRTLSGSMTGTNKFNNLSFSGNSPGTWNMGTVGVEVAGNLTVSGTGTLTATTDTLKVGGNFVHSGGAVTNFDPNNGVVNLNGAAGQAITNTKPTTFNYLVLTGAARNISPSGTMTVMSPFVIPSGDSLSLGTTLATFNDNFTNGGTLISGTSTVTFNSASGSHTVNGSLTGTNKFYKLTFNAPGSAWQFGATGATPVEIGNTFTITDGAITAPSDTMTLGGTFTYTAGTFNHNSGTVVYNGTAAQAIAGMAYNNLVVTGTTAAKTASGTATVAGNMYINTSTGAVALNASSIAGNLSISTTTGVITLANALDVNGSISISAATNTANAAFDVSASNYQINVAGNWTVLNTGTAAGIFNGRAGTVIFDGTGTQTIATGSGAVLPNFFNLQNANTSSTVSVSNNMTLGGSLTNNSGATLNTGATTLTVGGSWANNGSVVNTGTVAFNSTGAGNTLSGSMTGSNKFNNLTFSGNTPGTWSMGSDPVEVSGDFTISGTGTVTATSDTLKIGGNIVHSSGTASNFDPGTGVVNLNGAGAQSFPGAKATTFNVLNVTNTSATVTANLAITVNTALLSLAGSNINMSTLQLLGAFSASGHNGYLQTQCATTPPIPAGVTWGGTVDYNSFAGIQVVSAGTYNNLWLNGTTKAKTISAGTLVNGALNMHTTTGVITLAGDLDVNGNLFLGGSATNNIFDASTFQINCAGNWTDSSGTATTLFKANTGTVVFDGTGAQTISSSFGSVVPNFYNFRNSNTGSPITLSSSTSITGSLTIDTLAVLNVSSPTLTLAGDFINNGTYNASGTQAITVGGDWTNNGTFSSGVGSVTFNATTAGHTISGNLTGTNKFNNLTFSGNSPATWTFASVNVEAGGDFIISGTGTVNSTPAILRVGGNFGHNAGTAANFNANGGTVRLNGTASQTLPGSIATNFNTLTFTNSTPRMITATTTMTVATAFTVPSGDTLNMAAIPLTCSSDFTNSGVYMVSGAQALSVSGNFANTGTFSCGTGANALTVGGGYSNSGSFDASTGTVTFNGATGGSISGSMTSGNKFNNLTFNGAGAWSFGSNAAEVGAAFNITTGTVTAPSSTFTVTGTFNHAVAATFNHNNGTVTLNGAAQTMPGSATTFYDLNLSNASGTVTGNAVTTISHSLSSVAGNTLNMGTNQLLGSFSASGMAGTLTTQHTATTLPVPAGTTWGGTVNFNATTTAQTVPSGAYNNLSLTGTTGGKKNGGVSTVGGDLNITTTTGYDSLGVDSVGGNYSQVTTSGITTITSPLIVRGNTSITGTTATGIFDVTAANYQVSLGGDLTLTSTSAATLINARAGLFVFNGTGAQNISTSSAGTLTANFFSFRNSNTSNTISLSNNATISGDMTIDTGAVLSVSATTVTLNGNFLNNGTYTTSGAQTLNIKGDYTNNGTFTAGTGTVAFTAITSGHILSGNMTGSNKFNNLSFTGAAPGSWSMNNSVTVGADFTISGTGTVTATSDTLRVGGNFAHNAGTATNFKANGGIVRLNGTSAQTIPGTVATTFSTLTIAGTTRKLTANAAITTSNAFTIPSGDTLDMGAFAFTDSSNFTNNGVYTCSGAQTLTIGGSYANTGSFNSGIGTVVMNGASGSYTLSGNMANANGFYNLSFTGATPGAWAFSDSADANGNFTISGTGTVTAPASVLKVGGNFVHSAGTFLHNYGTVYMNNSIDQTLPGSVATTFGTLSMSNNLRNITLNKAITVVNAFTIPSNVFFLPVANAVVDSSDFTNNGHYTPTGAQVLTVKGNLVNSGAFTSGTGNPAVNISGGYTNTGTFAASTGTVIFNASSTGNIMSGSMTDGNAFNNLSFTGTGDLTANDSIDVTGNLSVTGAGTFVAPASIMKVAGNLSHSGGTFTHNYGTVYMNGTGTQTLPGNIATTFNTLSFSNDSRTITQNKGVTTVASLTIPSNVTYNAAANALTDSSDFIINGSFNTTGSQALIVRGNLTNNGTFSNAAAQTTTIGGSYANNGSFTAATGTVSFNSSSPGNTLTGSMTGANKFHNLSFTGTAPGAWSFDTNSTDVETTLTISGTGTVTAPSSILRLSGNMSHTAGTFNANGGTVELTNSGAQTIPGSAATTFNTLLIDDLSRTVTLTGATTINNAFTVPANVTLAAATFSLTASSSMTNLGTYTASAAQVLNVMGDFANSGSFTSGTTASALAFGGNYNNTGAFTAGAGTATFNGSGSYTLSGAMTGSNKFNNIVFNNASGNWSFGSNAADIGGAFTITNGSVTAPSSNLNVAGNFAHNGGSFDPNNGTVELSGAAQSMPGSATTFYNLNVSNGAGTVTANAATTISHALTTASGSTLNMAASQLLGSFDATGHTGTLNSQHMATAAPLPSGLTWGGTVNFNASIGSETVTDGTYNNLKVTSTSGSKPFAGPVTVNGDFTYTTTSGIATLGGDMVVLGNVSITGTTTNNVFDVSAGNYQITVGGNWTVSSTTAATLRNARAGTVLFNGTGVQNISVGAGAAIPGFFNLTYSNTGNPLNLGTNINVTGTLNVSAGASIIPSAAVVINSAAATGTITGSGTVQVTRTAATPDFSSQYKFTTNTLSGLTVDYSASGDQNVNSFTYGTLRTSGSGTKTAQGDITVNNLLDLTSGTTLDMGAANRLISGTAPAYSVTGTLVTSVPTGTSAAPIPSGISWGGTVQYGAAAGNQTVVSGSYNNLTLSNTSGVNALGGDATVSGTLALGKISVGSNNIILANTSSVTGASSSNYADVSGTGHVRKVFTADGSYMFPIGDASNYTPITIAMTGSGYSGAYVEGSVVASKSVHNLNANNYLNRTWTISTSGITSPSWSVINATYVPSDIVGLESAMISAAYLGSLPWNKYTTPASDTLATGAIASNIAEISAITAAVPTVDATPATPSYCSGGSSVLTATGGGGSGTLVYTWAPATALSATTGTVVTANPTTTDTTSYVTYTVTVTDGNGSYSTATVTLTVNPQPTAITGSLAVCQGLTTALGTTPSGGSWSSTMMSVATVGSSSGIVSGVSTGTSTISYMLGTGCYITADVTVNPSPSAIGGTAVVCEGLTTTLTNTVSGGTWASSSMSVATVGSSSGVVTGVLAGNSNITYTLPEGCYSIVNVTVNPLPAAITGTMTVCEGLTTTLADATSSGAWSSSNTSVATVGSSSGVVTGVLAGNATITYTLPTGCIITAVVTVNPSPSAIGGTAVVCEGLTTTLTNTVSGGTWASSSMSVATVGSSSGVVTGVLAGNSNITYTLPEGCYSIVNITVNPLPAAITGTMTVCEGLTTTLADATSSGAWSSSNTSVATVGSSSGVVTGVLAGNTTITYTLPTGCIMTAVVTVNPSPSAIGGTAVVCEGLTTTLTNTVSGGTWASSSMSVATVGSSSGVVTGVTGGNTTITYTLPEGCYSVRSVTVNPLPATITGSQVVCEGLTTTLSDATSSGTWSSGNTSVATVGSVSGIVSGVLAGNATITYMLPTGCIQTAVVTVNMSPAAITGINNVCEGLTISLSDATSSGTWSSSNTSAATVDMSGVVTGVAAGNTTISYTLPNACFSVMAVTVNPLPAAITGLTVVCEGKSNTLADATAGGTWSSGATGTATVGSATGILTGVAAGNTTVTYTLPTGCIMSTPVTVNPSPAAITGTNAMCIGFTTTLADATGGGTWSSSNTSIATVNSSGVVSGILNGNATITYTLPEGCYSTRLVTVYATPTAITGTTVVCEGATSTLGNGVSGGTWSSSNYGVASISLVSGIVTGIAQGTATITYTLSTGCTAMTVVTVNPAPHAGTVSGPTSVGVGSMITLTDGVAGGAWSASNGNATVGSTGIVTGVSAGTVTISYSYTNSCGTAVAPLVVTVSASVGITGTGYVCIGSTTTLTNATGGGVWVSSNTSIATVGSSTGVVTGVTAGTCTVSYTVSGTTSTKVVTVTASVAAVTGSSAVCKDASTTLSCSVPGGTWLTNNSAIATVDPATGLVTGVSAGTTTITYSFGTSCYRPFTFTVRPLPAAIAGSGTVCIGSTTTLTDPTSGGVMWQSSNTSVATIGSISGVVTGVSAGTTTITYVLATGCYTTTPVSVNALPSAITGTASACSGATTTLSDPDMGGTWSSGSTIVATVGSSTGVVTGVSAGTANITYTGTTGCKRTQVVTINPSPNAITGATTICQGSTSTLSSTTTGGTWSTSTPSVATIGTSSGVVTGVSIGSSTITYTISTGCSAATVVNVGIALDANTGTAVACTGRTTTLSNATPGGTWSSGATGTATVNASTGVVTGVAAGTASISYATGGGCRSITIVTVNQSPATITGSTSVCVNSIITLSDATMSGTWSSSNTALGTVNSSTGVVTGISAGTPAITYTVSNGCYQTSNITVKAIPAVPTGTSALCTGATTTFTDATSGGVSWMSSNTSVATIGSISGVVTAVGAGTTTITFNLLAGCYNTTVVTVSATPSAGTITGPTTVVIGNTITLSDAAVAGGTWSSGSTGVATVGSASGIVTGVSAGGSTITYTVNNGCGVATTTQAITVTTSRPGGTAIKLADGKSLMLYPNPTSGAFTIEAPEAGTIVMSTLEGQSVAKLDVAAGINAVDVPKGVAAGIYMCRFTGNSGSIVVIRLVYEP